MKKPTDTVYYHLPTTRLGRLAFKQACERRGTTMQAVISTLTANYVAREKSDATIRKE